MNQSIEDQILKVRLPVPILLHQLTVKDFHNMTTLSSDLVAGKIHIERDTDIHNASIKSCVSFSTHKVALSY